VDPGVKTTGDRLPGGRIEMNAVPPTGKILDVFGFLKGTNGPFLSMEIEEIAARGWARQANEDFGRATGVLQQSPAVLGRRMLVARRRVLPTALK
jgi:hypothetical protein